MFLNLKLFCVDEEGKYFTVPCVVNFDSVVCVYPSAEFAGVSVLNLSTGDSILVYCTVQVLQAVLSRKIKATEDISLL